MSIFTRISKDGVIVSTVNGRRKLVKKAEDFVKHYLSYEILGLFDVVRALVKISTVDRRLTQVLESSLGSKHPLTILSKIVKDSGDSVTKILNKIDNVERDVVNKVLNDVECGETILIHGVSSTKLLKHLIGKNVKFILPEYRPSLIQAKVIAKYLVNNGAEVTIVSDNMPAYIMWEGRVSKFISEGLMLSNNILCRSGVLTYSISAHHTNVDTIIFCLKVNGIKYTLQEVPLRQDENVKVLNGLRIAPVNINALMVDLDNIPRKYIAKLHYTVLL
ncbi:MAG TPA: hypothetical protein EYH40_05860 [Desulfurococcales archaeon]|nr:hypothetical protein [Desulfurococcales archaeon]